MKIHNFCAGPSILPTEVFEEASNAIKDLNGSGLSLLEISHRSHAFVEIMDEARDLSLELLGLNGNDYSSLFLQGGASSQFLMVAYNFLRNEAGYLNKNKQDNKVEYNVNIKQPLYDTMKRVVMKHLGLEDIVETVLDKMGNVKEILLIGDYAKGIDSGNIEIFLIGKNLNMDYIENLEVKIEKLINRKVTFYLSSKFSSNQTSIILYKNN